MRLRWPHWRSPCRRPRSRTTRSATWSTLGDWKVAVPTLEPGLDSQEPDRSRRAAAAARARRSGTTKIWPLIDFTTGGSRLRTFTLRGVGAKIEIWVSNKIELPGRRLPQRRRPEPDHRRPVDVLRGAVRREHRPEAVRPSARRPPATAPVECSSRPGVVPPGYSGPGDKVVTLVANFKDENYTDIDFPSYVAGYHSADINDFVNRNVMSVDSYDWAHAPAPTRRTSPRPSSARTGRRSRSSTRRSSRTSTSTCSSTGRAPAS